MVTSRKNSIYLNINITAAIITLALSPNINKDSLIIPKVILLFVLALYLIPKLVFNVKTLMKTQQFKILTIILFLIVMQLIIVFISSKAPFEQQLYGRTGRGLGFLTHISLLIIMLAAALFLRKSDLRIIIKFLVISAAVTSVYSILQSFGIDFLKWDSRTNGVIGTLGNPNFQSSFAAIALVPAVFTFWRSKYKYYFALGFMIIFIWTIYRTQSTQGYVSSLLGICMFGIIFFWYRNRLIAIIASLLSVGVGFIAVFGMLNFGPLKSYLYKISVQSRGDFWRSAMATANDNPVTGVGIDSFGDSYLKYRDSIAVSHPWAEYADNAHNYFLEYAATGGYPLLVLHLILIIFILYTFILTQNRLAKFDLDLAILFTAWVVFQAQSVISPGSISLMLWNSIISGAIIGYSVLVGKSTESSITINSNQDLTRPFSALLIIFGLILYYPYFNTDRLQMLAMSTTNGDLAIQSAQKFPESVLRYTVITRELLNSGLPQQALEVARSAVEFNPNSPNLWALILINPSAPIDERQKAKGEILKLDPLNKEVLNYKLP